MKLSSLSLVAVFALVAFSGCASIYPVGTLYTDVQIPVESSSASAACPKVGTSEATSILGLVATGDASIQTAAANAGITKINTIDWDVENILGIIGTYKTTVCGE